MQKCYCIFASNALFSYFRSYFRSHNLRMIISSLAGRSNLSFVHAMFTTTTCRNLCAFEIMMQTVYYTRYNKDHVPGLTSQFSSLRLHQLLMADSMSQGCRPYTDFTLFRIARFKIVRQQIDTGLFYLFLTVTMKAHPDWNCFNASLRNAKKKNI